jgi:hypothetical protein
MSEAIKSDRRDLVSMVGGSMSMPGLRDMIQEAHDFIGRCHPLGGINAQGPRGAKRASRENPFGASRPP